MVIRKCISADLEQSVWQGDKGQLFALQCVRANRDHIFCRVAKCGRDGEHRVSAQISGNFYALNAINGDILPVEDAVRALGGVGSAVGGGVSNTGGVGVSPGGSGVALGSGVVMIGSSVGVSDGFPSA